MKDDDQTKALFAELGRDEERAAPGFGAVWAAAGSQLQRQRRWRYVRSVSGVAAGLLILAVVARRPVKHTAPRQSDGTGPATFSATTTPGPKPALPWRTALLVCEWRAPTDFLLQPPATSSANFQLNSVNPNP